MTIHFETASAFHDAVAALVQRGLTFEARELVTGRYLYEITLTGGY